MKIRNGFVSNSSSSSFLIFGIYIDDISELTPLVSEEDMNIYDIMENIIPGNVLHWYIIPWDEDDVYIGLDWDQVQDDETGAEFKTRVTDLINQYLGKSYQISDLSTHKAAWHD